VSEFYLYLGMTPYSDRPDISQSERDFLPDQFPFVPGLTAPG